MEPGGASPLRTMMKRLSSTHWKGFTSACSARGTDPQPSTTVRSDEVSTSWALSRFELKGLSAVDSLMRRNRPSGDHVTGAGQVPREGGVRITSVPPPSERTKKTFPPAAKENLCPSGDNTMPLTSNR